MKSSKISWGISILWLIGYAITMAQEQLLISNIFIAAAMVCSAIENTKK